MLAVYKRDLKSYFVTMIGSVLVAFVVALAGIYFSYYCLNGGYPYYGDMICSVANVLMLCLPILTMRSFAEEQKTKSDQILYTSGATITSIVMGKYLAMTTVWLAPFLVCCSGPLVLSEFGTPNYAGDYLAIIAVFMIGCAYIAVGMFLSSLTESPIIAGILTFAVLFVLQLMDGITSFIPSTAFASMIGCLILVGIALIIYQIMAKKWIATLILGIAGAGAIVGMYIKDADMFNNLLPNLLNQLPLTFTLDNAGAKLLDFSDFIYYVSIIVLFVFLTTQSIRMRNSLRSSRFKSGSYSAGMIAIVIAITLFVNLFARQVPASIMTVDFSDQKLYTLSEDSKKVVEKIDKDVTVYQLANSGNEDTGLKKLLEQYKAVCSGIEIKTLDPELSPGLVSTYDAMELAQNSLIVVSGEKYKTISYEEIYEMDYSSYYYTGTTYTNFDGEGEITSALHYVTTEDLPVMYTLNGHGEQEFSSIVTALVEKQNVQLNELNLLTTESVPEDCDVLAIVAPEKDCSESEAEKIIQYLEQGGNAIIIALYTGEEKPNFDEVIKYYGVKLQEGYVYEKSRDHQANNGYYLLPDVGTHEITESVVADRLYVMTPYSQGIVPLEEESDTANITDLLTTTEDSYADFDYGEDGSTLKGENDKEGPLAIAVASQVTTEESKESKGVIFGTYNMFVDGITQSYTLGNLDLLINSLKWMTGEADTISIPTKSMDIAYNTVAASKAGFYTSVFCVIIPLAALITGFIIWIRRRKA